MYIQNRPYGSFLKGSSPVQLLYNLIVNHPAITYFTYTHRYVQLIPINRSTMKIILSRLFYLVFILSLIGCKESPSRKEIDLKTRVKAGTPIPDGIMDTLLEGYNVPAISIATIHNGEIDWVKAYGVRQYGSSVKVDSTTLFQAASISKPVSAVIALHLVDRGELSLDEDVNIKLQTWKVPLNEFTKTEPVTIRRLLSHSAGLPMHGVPEFNANAKIPSLVQILDGDWNASNESVRPFVVPGKEYHYSGGGYIVLQVLLNDISHRPFEELAEEFVLKRAGMNSSTFEQPLPKDLWSQAAVGHQKNGVPLKGSWHTLPEQAAGGLWTTPKDLACFMIELWKSYQGISDTLLPQYLAREMLTRQIDDMGLGIALPSYGVFRFTHSGGNAGYRCFMVLSVNVPDGVVVMTNGDSGEQLIWEVFELIAYAYNWEV